MAYPLSRAGGPNSWSRFNARESRPTFTEGILHFSPSLVAFAVFLLASFCIASYCLGSVHSLIAPQSQSKVKSGDFVQSLVMSRARRDPRTPVPPERTRETRINTGDFLLPSCSCHTRLLPPRRILSYIARPASSSVNGSSLMWYSSSNSLQWASSAASPASPHRWTTDRSAFASRSMKNAVRGWLSGPFSNSENLSSVIVPAPSRFYLWPFIFPVWPTVSISNVRRQDVISRFCFYSIRSRPPLAIHPVQRFGRAIRGRAPLQNSGRDRSTSIRSCDRVRQRAARRESMRRVSRCPP